MRKENNKKGITLVSLVITILILLILAGISISTLTNTGIFEKAKDAKKASENAKLEQNKVLDEYEKELDKYMPQELTDDKINKVLNMTENTFLKDANGNKFNKEHLLKYRAKCHYMVTVMREMDGEVVLYSYDVPNSDLFKFMKSFDGNTLDGTIIEIDKYFPEDLAWKK